MPKSLLIIAHAPSPNTSALAEAALRGASHPDAGGLNVRLSSPFDIEAEHLFGADGVLIGTTENIGYMAGRQRTCSTAVIMTGSTEARPSRSASTFAPDLTAQRPPRAESIIGAQRWRLVAAPLILHGDWSDGYPAEVEDWPWGWLPGLMPEYSDRPPAESRH